MCFRNLCTVIVAFLMTALSMVGCTSTGNEGNTEPVAPEMDSNTGYPEDPDLGATPGEEQPAVTEPSTPEEDTPGELTDDPYGSLPDNQNKDTSDDIMTKPNPPEVDMPDASDDITGSFEEPQPNYEPSPDGPAIETPFTDEEPSSQGKKSVSRYVRAILLNVREKPSHKSPIVRRLLGGAKVNVEIHGSFAKIRSGQWVHTKYLSSKPTKKVTWKDVQAAWKKSKYKDTWKPQK